MNLTSAWVIMDSLEGGLEGTIIWQVKDWQYIHLGAGRHSDGTHPSWHKAQRPVSKVLLPLCQVYSNLCGKTINQLLSWKAQILFFTATSVRYNLSDYL